MNTTPLQVIIREPGNGVRYVILTANLTDLPQDQRRSLGVGSDVGHQATLTNFPGRPSLIFTNYVVPSYALEKCPSLSIKDAEVFAGICNEILES